MLKGIGAIFLLIAAWSVGLSLRRDEKKRLELLQDSLALIRHAHRKIELFTTPADSLFIDFTDGFDPVTRKSFVEDSAQTALEKIAEQLGEYGAPLYKLSQEIGCGYKEDVLRLFTFCEESVAERLSTAQERFTRRKKLYTALPILLAISVIVLFL